jgi:hypothetical protein
LVISTAEVCVETLAPFIERNCDGPAQYPGLQTGFAAMGVVELLVHTFDAVHGLDSSSTWTPPNDLAIPVLKRLFPHTPSGMADPPGELLLHMCGRIPLGERPRKADWRWYGAVPRMGPTNAL